jgi:transposase
MARTPSWRAAHEQRADRCPVSPHPTPSTPTQKARTSSGPRPPTINGTLYVLRTGCRWHDLPPEYGSPVTCWRRLDNGKWMMVPERGSGGLSSALWTKQESWTGAEPFWMAASSCDSSVSPPGSFTWRASLWLSRLFLQV